MLQPVPINYWPGYIKKNKTDEQIYYAWKNYEGSFSNISGDAESQIMTQRYQGRTAQK